MAIDGVGQRGGAPKVSSGVGAAQGVDSEKFELTTEGVEKAEGAQLLERVQRGEVQLDAYLDVRVNDAVGHLEGKLSAEQLEFVREELREQLRNDPVLIELVRRATGQTPEARDV